MKYKNHGAPFTRDEGGVWARGAIHEPTPNELRRRKYKLRAIAPEPPVTAPDSPWPLAMDPKMYLQLHPEGEHVELARTLVRSEEEEPEEAPEEEVEEEADGTSDN